MKLRNAINARTILIPSLLLNLGLFGSTVFFANQIDLFLPQATAPVLRSYVHSHRHNVEPATHQDRADISSDEVVPALPVGRILALFAQ